MRSDFDGLALGVTLWNGRSNPTISRHAFYEQPTVLIATFKLRAGQDNAFASWQVRVNELIAKAPGYISSDILPPKTSGDRTWSRGGHWTTMLRYDT